MVGAGGFVQSALSEPPPFGVDVYTLASTSSANVLPVELIKFEVKPRSGSIDLKWQTESEINASHFLVERSADGINFEAIDYVQSKGGVTTPALYTISDPSPYSGWNYYRLKMIDLYASYEYSPIEVVKVAAHTSLAVYPNPVGEVLIIQDTEMNTGAVKIEIFNQNASKMLERNLNRDRGPLQLMIDDVRSFPAGYYILKITDTAGCTFTNFVKSE